MVLNRTLTSIIGSLISTEKSLTQRMNPGSSAPEYTPIASQCPMSTCAPAGGARSSRPRAAPTSTTVERCALLHRATRRIGSDVGPVELRVHEIGTGGLLRPGDACREADRGVGPSPVPRGCRRPKREPGGAENGQDLFRRDATGPTGELARSMSISSVACEEDAEPTCHLDLMPSTEMGGWSTSGRASSVHHGGRACPGQRQ